MYVDRACSLSRIELRIKQITVLKLVPHCSGTAFSCSARSKFSQWSQKVFEDKYACPPNYNLLNQLTLCFTCLLLKKKKYLLKSWLLSHSRCHCHHKHFRKVILGKQHVFFVWKESWHDCRVFYSNGSKEGEAALSIWVVLLSQLYRRKMPRILSEVNKVQVWATHALGYLLVFRELVSYTPVYLKQSLECKKGDTFLTFLWPQYRNPLSHHPPQIFLKNVPISPACLSPHCV